MLRQFQIMLGNALKHDYIKLDVYRDGDYVVVDTMNTRPCDEIHFEFKYSALCCVGITQTINLLEQCIKYGICTKTSDDDFFIF
ncbi:MAG: hypothetical protein J6S67_09880 [Methanobrevibacter sp.]|nr:hypothetical protein [Methanobrevibacter sp.]